jgi:hypothetical protein
VFVIIILSYGLVGADSLLYSDDSVWGSFSGDFSDAEGNEEGTPSMLQSWDGLDGSMSLFDDKALSSLPFGDVEAEEAAAAASEGVPTYRGSGDGQFSGGTRSGIPPSLPTSRVFRKPGTQTPEEAALEEFLMNKAVDEGMTLHHARLEAAHNRFSVASAFGELLEDIEQDDVWRNAEPLLPGTDLRMPTWIRASEAILPLMDELNAKTEQFEIELSEYSIQEAEEKILEEVESARRLLSLTDPKAGLSVDNDVTDLDALDEFFADGDTLLPGALDVLHGEEGELRRMAEAKDNSVMNSLLEEILPEISGYALDYGEGQGGSGMLSGALQALSDEVDTVLEEDGESEMDDLELKSSSSEDEDDDIAVE